MFVITQGELWRTDGTEAGTQRISALPEPPFTSGNPLNPGYSNLTGMGNRVYFTIELPGEGALGWPAELWVSDGTEAGTHAVDQIPPRYPGARFLTPVRDSLFFMADDGVHGTEIWVIPSAQSENIVGDSNHDGRFDSADFVAVFAAGKYEDGIPGNATFEEGDWNGDGDFDSGDMVFAFQAGTYEVEPPAARPRPNQLAAAAIDQIFAETPGRSRRGGMLA